MHSAIPTSYHLSATATACRVRASSAGGVSAGKLGRLTSGSGDLEGLSDDELALVLHNLVSLGARCSRGAQGSQQSGKGTSSAATCVASPQSTLYTSIHVSRWKGRTFTPGLGMRPRRMHASSCRLQVVNARGNKVRLSPAAGVKLQDFRRLNAVFCKQSPMQTSTSGNGAEIRVDPGRSRQVPKGQPVSATLDPLPNDSTRALVPFFS